MSDVYVLLLDGETVWFGTNLGLCRYTKGANTYESMAGNSSIISALIRIDRLIVCGSRQNGLTAFDPRSSEWRDMNSLYGIKPVSVSALAVDSERLWIGTENGLIVVDRQTKRSLRTPVEMTGASITALHSDGATVWIGTNKGLFRYIPDKEDVTGPYAGLPDRSVTSLLRTGDGLLIGTRSGLGFLKQGSSNAVFEVRYVDRQVSSITADEDHCWIGTLGTGLSQVPIRRASPEKTR